MPNQALAEIVAVEKEIQTRLAEERNKAAIWVAEERELINSGVKRQLSEAQREFRQSVATVEAEAKREVTALVSRAEEYAARLRDLPDERLRSILTSHLVRLLPEKKR